MSAPPRPNLRKTLPRILTRAEVASLFRIKPKSLQYPAWDRRLRPFRTPTGRRRYDRDVVLDVLDWWFR